MNFRDKIFFKAPFKPKSTPFFQTWMNQKKAPFQRSMRKQWNFLWEDSPFAHLVPLLDLVLVQGVQTLTPQLIKSLGFTLELRHFGSLKVGLWRKKFSRKPQTFQQKVRWSLPALTGPFGAKAKSDMPQNPRKRLVVIPGFGDSPLTWLPVVTQLSEQIEQMYDELVMIDFPGFGGVLHDEEAFPSMDSMMKVTQEILSSLRPHTLIGHSLGGWLAAFYASLPVVGRRYDDASQKIPKELWGEPGEYRYQLIGEEDSLKVLILADPAGLVTNPQKVEKLSQVIAESQMNGNNGFEIEKKVEESQEEEDWASLFAKSLGPKGFEILRPHIFAQEPLWFPCFLPHFEKFLKRADIRTFMSSIQKEHLLQDRLSLIDCDTFLLWGEKDTLVPLHYLDHWIESLSYQRVDGHALNAEPLRKRVSILRDAGHSLHLESKKNFCEALSNILHEVQDSQINPPFHRLDDGLEKKSAAFNVFLDSK